MGINMSKLKINHLLTLSLLSLGLTACGGGSSGSGVTVYNGVFKDSNVSGLSYISGNQKGVTGTNGEFKYEEDSDVSFSVGGVDLGTGKGNNVMTPIDLVESGTLDTPEVLNRVRFLMMLDKDNDVTNGIEISSQLREKAKSWTTLDFSSDKFNQTDPETEINLVSEMSKDAVRADNGEHNLPKTEDARAHFSSTLEVIKSTERCSDAGAFTGTYSGSESGNLALILDPSTGYIKGSLFNTDETTNSTPAEIGGESAIDYDTDSKTFISLSNSGIKLSGQLSSSNTLEGTWEDTEDDTIKGTFVAKRIGGSGGASYRYNALYEGLSDSDLGILAIDLASNNELTGITYDVKSATTSDISGSVKLDEFSNVALSDGGQISIFITETSTTGTLIDGSNSSNSFEGKGCKLN